MDGVRIVIIYLSTIVRKVVSIVLILAFVYVGIGVGFHIRWKRAQTVCRETRIARGEFVEPETFGPVISLVFDVINWPIYAWANLHHFGDPFSIPCTRDVSPPEVASLKASRQALEEQGLGWEEHALVGPLSLMPLTFNPVEGTQAEILSKHQAERATSARAPCYPECRVSLGDDSLVASATTVDARDGGQKVFVEVLREGETIYSTELGDVCVVSPLWGLWTYGDHWVLEAVHVQAHRQDRAITCEPTGQIIRDGQSLNEQQGYQESFGFQLLNEKPFYFYKRTGQLGVSYGGQEIPLRYTHISHYQCCSGAAANLRSSQSMVAFFARRDGTRYYVEIGVLE